MPAMAVLNDRSEPDERKKARTAGYDMLRRALDPEEVTPDFLMGRTLSFAQDEGVWIVPLGSIQAVYLKDPELKIGAKGFVFRVEDSSAVRAWP